MPQKDPRKASRLRRGLLACLLTLGFAGAAAGAEESVLRE